MPLSTRSGIPASWLEVWRWGWQRQDAGQPLWPLGKGRNAAGASVCLADLVAPVGTHRDMAPCYFAARDVSGACCRGRGRGCSHCAQQQLLGQEPPLALTAQGAAGAPWGTQAGDACTDLHHWRGKRDRDKACLLLISPCVSSDSQIFLVL